MKPLTIKISEPRGQRTALEGTPRKSGKNALAREAIEGQVAMPSVSRGLPSILDLAGDLIGKRKGPGDLATNPRYLKSFGK